MQGVSCVFWKTRVAHQWFSPLVLPMLNDPDLFSLGTLISAAKNHWLAAAFVFILTMALAVAAMFLLPKAYESEAMIFVKLGRETVSLDPTASTGSKINVLESRDNEINSIRDMLYSRSIIESVVDRIGPEVVLGDEDFTGERVEDIPDSSSDYKNSPRQKAIRQLTEDTYIISTRKSSVLTLNAKASSPQLAQRVLLEYLESFQKMHAEAHQTPNSDQFFEKQTRLKESQWQEAMKALQIAEEDAEVGSIDGARANLKEQTHATQSSLMSVESQLFSTKAMVEKFDRIVDNNPLDQRTIRAEYLDAQAKLSAFTAQKETLDRQLVELRDRSAKLNKDALTIGQLTKEVDHAAASYLTYQELLEQVRIEEALTADQFTNVRVTQPPSFVPKAVSPKKSILGIAGLVAATSGAVLMALFLELFFTRRPKGGKLIERSDSNVIVGNDMLGTYSISTD